jgi:hypothetical protein
MCLLVAEIINEGTPAFLKKNLFFTLKCKFFIAAEGIIKPNIHLLVASLIPVDFFNSPSLKLGWPFSTTYFISFKT